MVKKVNWGLTLVMSAIFGMFGADRFVMGHVGLGVLKLILTIITFGSLGGVWWIIDLVLIATKHEFEGIKWVY